MEMRSVVIFIFKSEHNLYDPFYSKSYVSKENPYSKNDYPKVIRIIERMRI